MQDRDNSSMYLRELIRKKWEDSKKMIIIITNIVTLDSFIIKLLGMVATYCRDCGAGLYKSRILKPPGPT